MTTVVGRPRPRPLTTPSTCGWAQLSQRRTWTGTSSQPGCAPCAAAPRCRCCPRAGGSSATAAASRPRAAPGPASLLPARPTGRSCQRLPAGPLRGAASSGRAALPAWAPAAQQPRWRGGGRLRPDSRPARSLADMLLGCGTAPGSTRPWKTPCLCFTEMQPGSDARCSGGLAAAPADRPCVRSLKWPLARP